MRNIIIYASKSLTISNKFPNKNLNDEIISVGNDGTYYYHSYLFFDISPIPDNISIHSAEIVLFKVQDFFDCYRVRFSLYPILDYFSAFTTWKNPPTVDMNLKKNFIPLTCSSCAEIDVTDIVIRWLDDTLINKGFLLVGDFTKTCLTSFGSALNKDSYLIPFLRISFKELRPTTPNTLPFYKLAYEVKS